VVKRAHLAVAAVLLCACGSKGTSGTTSSSTASGGTGGATSTGSTTASGTTTTTSGTGGSLPAPPTAADLLAKLAGCNQISNGLYKTDSDAASATIPLCGLTGAVWWTADMDVDCDGKQSAQCNLIADPAYQPETSATDSNGDYLDSAALPYVVIPLPSSRFDYGAGGLELGSVVAVIYKGQLQYGVFGDEGPSSIIGEASYAMAQSLGIDPDPSYGGTDGPVTYIAFTGATGVAAPIESHAAAVAVGEARAAQLLHEN
jgi:hypothetical protein